MAPQGAGPAPASPYGPSLKICSVAGVPVRVHFLLPAVTLVSVGSALAAGGGAAGAILAALVSGPLLFGTVLAHEMGHIAAARRCGLVPEHILLWPMGGLAIIGGGSVTPKEQIFISGSGPATHLPMMLLWAVALAACNGGRMTLSLSGLQVDSDFAAVMCVCLLVNNLSMLIFNLLVPCFPLDCSKILMSGMLLCGHDSSTTAKVMVALSVPVIVVLAGLGIWWSVAGSSAASMNFFVAVWLAMQTWQLQQARVRGELNHHPLFAAGPPAQPRPPVGSPPAMPTSGGVVLGSSSDKGGQVCIGSILSLAIVVLAVAQTAPPLH